jgi:hypothetical protein
MNILPSVSLVHAEALPKLISNVALELPGAIPSLYSSKHTVHTQYLPP